MKLPMASEIPDRPEPERRAEPRVVCKNVPAELTIVRVGGSVTTIPATVVGVSKSGLKVLADTRMNPGQPVRIKMGNLIIFGEVRHSHAEGAVFENGVKISDIVGERGLCDRITQEQIECLALGRLSATEQMYAQYHLQYCETCAAQLRATKMFFEKVRCA